MCAVSDILNTLNSTRVCKLMSTTVCSIQRKRLLQLTPTSRDESLQHGADGVQSTAADVAQVRDWSPLALSSAVLGSAAAGSSL